MRYQASSVSRSRGGACTKARARSCRCATVAELCFSRRRKGFSQTAKHAKKKSAAKRFLRFGNTYMSRTGKLPIKIPAGTEVSVSGGEIIVKGKGGTLKRPLHSSVSVSVANGEVVVAPIEKTRLARALWGTYAAHVRNMLQGVGQPFVKKLQVEGIGYRAEPAGKQLKLTVGFSHPVLVAIPEGLTVAVD